MKGTSLLSRYMYLIAYSHPSGRSCLVHFTNTETVEVEESELHVSFTHKRLLRVSSINAEYLSTMKLRIVMHVRDINKCEDIRYIGIRAGPAGTVCARPLFRRLNEIYYRYTFQLHACFKHIYYSRTSLKVPLLR